MNPRAQFLGLRLGLFKLASAQPQYGPWGAVGTAAQSVANAAQGAGGGLADYARNEGGRLAAPYLDQFRNSKNLMSTTGQNIGTTANNIQGTLGGFRDTASNAISNIGNERISNMGSAVANAGRDIYGAGRTAVSNLGSDIMGGIRNQGSALARFASRSVNNGGQQMRDLMGLSPAGIASRAVNKGVSAFQNATMPDVPYTPPGAAPAPAAPAPAPAAPAPAAPAFNNQDALAGAWKKHTGTSYNGQNPGADRRAMDTALKSIGNRDWNSIAPQEQNQIMNAATGPSRRR